MKIEEGKYYRSREGKKIGPMKLDYSRDRNIDTPWITPGGCLYHSDGRRWIEAGAPQTDLISEWKEEETAMDYATMNEFMDYLRELRAIKLAEFDEKVEEIRKIDSLINKIDSQYPKPEEEK